jgi:T5SS/PEP-CTERM-associated repeat protein
VTNNELTVGGTNTGTLTISSGGIVNDGSSGIGGAPSSTGTVNVTGPNSKWIQAQDLRIGGLDNLNGMAASGSLAVTLGGHVITGGDAQVGSIGAGSASFEDNGTEWSVSGDTFVDEAGSLTVAAGAKATTTTASVRGNVLIDQNGANWNVSDYLEVAGQVCLGMGCMEPQGTVNLSNGASVTSRVTVVGTEFGSPIVFVDGAGSTWSNSEQMYIGLAGGGNFIVTGGGRVFSTTVEMGVASTGSGIASVDASTWANSGDFTVGIAGTGKLTVSSGGLVSVAGLLAVGPHGTVEGNSQLSGNIRNAGAVAPGVTTNPPSSSAIGTLNVAGNYTQVDTGALDMELAAITSFDRFTISGAASLDGALDVTLIDGFVPSIGEPFDLLTASGGVSGTFSSLNLPPLLTGPHGPFWTVVYTPTDVILELVSSLTGDYNHNGTVDAADYVVWRKAGINGQQGYDDWRANFGQTAGSGSSPSVNAAVPEPATIVLLVMGTLAMCFRRRDARVP